jgi:hypothetical protein
VVLGQIENSVLESDKVPLREEVAKHNENIKGCQAAVAAAKEEMTAAMATIFSTTANFFRGDGKTPWDNIVHEQTEKDPWTNLRWGGAFRSPRQDDGSLALRLRLDAQDRVQQ